MNDLDFVTDHNPNIDTFLYTKGVTPDYVLKSDRVTEEDIAKLDKVAFADPDHNLYPCHTKAACWQSAAHFIGRHKTDSGVLANIEKMASYHGISEDIETLKKTLCTEEDTVEKQASVQETRKYALTVDFTGFTKEGGVEKFYPVNNFEEVVDSAEDSTEDFNRGNLPIEAMRKVASIINAAAREFGVPDNELTREVITIGNDNTPDAGMALYKLASRRRLGVDITPYESELVELSKKASEMSLEDYMEAADATADRLVALDKEAGVRYNSTVEDPYSMIMCGPSVREIEKAAANTVDILGIRVPVADLVNLSDEDLDNEFSKSASSIIKEAKTLVSGNNTIATSCAAGDKLAELSSDSAKVLLGKLANTAW